ncbi:hypothetical protein EZV62_024818 [Acer yangbiense]|uniref:MADS-box domain-containing protein n=1 Tax=Acer yangbiense TaxID=1000413 RepID=A0A5C7GW41_9ROSI|nr:hypothetical protein EZV62_024818 [Acer yangbiense]
MARRKVKLCSLRMIPKGNPYEDQPDVWPSHHRVQRIMSQFKRMPEMEQSKRMVDQDSFLRQRITKSNDQLIKQMKDNREQEMTALMFETLVGRSLCPLGMMDLNDLGWTIEQYLKDIYKYQSNTNNRMTMVVGSSSSSAAATAAALLAPTPPLPSQAPALDHGVTRTVGESSQAATSSSGGIDQMEKQSWCMNLMSP